MNDRKIRFSLRTINDSSLLVLFCSFNAGQSIGNPMFWDLRIAVEDEMKRREKGEPAVEAWDVVLEPLTDEEINDAGGIFLYTCVLFVELDEPEAVSLCELLFEAVNREKGWRALRKRAAVLN